MILLFVESPAKIKKIEGLLGPKYKVLASIGHIMDLDPKNMSIEIENNFKPIYVINQDKVNVVKDLKSTAKKASDILIATDEDREGEIIAWCIANVLGLKNPKRITFNSITKQALTEAVSNPRQIDYNLVNAQKTRRILDRIVGFELSPLLFKNFGQYNLSAGRVQSVVARLIVDRENEIKKFMLSDLKSFFKFKGVFLSNNKPFDANLYDFEGVNGDGFFKGSQSKLDGIDNSKKFLTSCMTSKFIVAHVFDKKRTQGPAPPFTTSTLQQEANRKMGFTGKRTMSSAQRLYEAGYITYMRTDSVNLSDEALDNIQQYVIDTYGNNYYRRIEYKSKSKNTQEAHEAIRPTDVFTTEIEVKDKIGYDEVKLYSLIWKRTVASQMQPAEYNVTSIQISIDKIKNYFFMTTIENLIFPGFLVVYNVKKSDTEYNEDNEDNIDEECDDNPEKEKSNKNIKIPKVGTELGVKKINGTQDYVKPPGRYNYASLTDKLDPKNLNIGRPATYVSIIEKIVDREYVKISDCDGKDVDAVSLTWEPPTKKIKEEPFTQTLGKEKGRYVPTNLGVMVTYYLIQNFPKIVDYQFTAHMEEKLDEIASGDLVWHEVLKEFYDEFHPIVMSIRCKKTDIEEKYTKLLGCDPKTGFEIYATLAKYGPVYKLMSTPGKPKCSPIKEPFTLETATLEDALKSFEYPKDLGIYEKKQIQLQKGEYGFYLIHNKNKYSVQDKNNISLNEAIEVIKSKQNKGLATFKTDKMTYVVLDGQFGKYIRVMNNKTQKAVNVTLPKNEDIDSLTLDRIDEILNDKQKGKQVKTKTTKTTKTVKKAKSVKTAKSVKVKKTAKNKNIELV